MSKFRPFRAMHIHAILGGDKKFIRPPYWKQDTTNPGRWRPNEDTQRVLRKEYVKLFDYQWCGIKPNWLVLRAYCKFRFVRAVSKQRIRNIAGALSRKAIKPKE